MFCVLCRDAYVLFARDTKQNVCTTQTEETIWPISPRIRSEKGFRIASARGAKVQAVSYYYCCACLLYYCIYYVFVHSGENRIVISKI